MQGFGGVSIIISTRNRARSLDQTLAALNCLEIPENCSVELIVVDNDSSDETSSIIQKYSHSTLPLRGMFNPDVGLSLSRNIGCRASNGEVIVFTDDDVRPQADWLTKLTAPLLQNEADAVVGHIDLAPHLERNWMQQIHKHWLAETHIDPRQPELVGANMAVRREALEKLEGFDTKLGPGVSGFGEDTLFSWQLLVMGARMKYIAEAKVVHHPDASRLLRSSWLRAAAARGETQAYLTHHWRHHAFTLPRLRVAYLSVKLAIRRILQPPPRLHDEGCPAWEMSYVGQKAMYHAFVKEKRQARRYPRFGATEGKINHRWSGIFLPT